MHPLFPDPETGPYTLVERLGAGGSGEVFRAIRHRAFVREVCIKRLCARFSETEARAEMREEARVLGAVRHANVVALLDAGEDRKGAPFLVLEYVRGEHLGIVREAPRFDRRLAVHVACSVLRALAAVERVMPKIVHRDVSPQNILVSSEGEVKLADFGIALTEHRARWTLPNFVKGKLGYMAPEQIRGERLDPRADLYSLGVVLYELLAGIRPCHPARGMEELRRTVKGLQRPIAEVRPLPAALTGVVDRMCAADPARRFRHPEEALALLAPFGAGDLGPLTLAEIVRTRAYNGTKVTDSTSTIPMET